MAERMTSPAHGRSGDTFDRELIERIRETPDCTCQKQGAHLLTWLLKPRSVLFFTNIAEGNPYKTMIEHFGAWHLKERSLADVESLVSMIPARGRQMTITRDNTGLALLAELRIDRVDTSHD